MSASSETTDSKTLQPHENVNGGSGDGTMPGHRSAQAFKVYSFRRWSSRLQADGDSDRRQLDAALAYCEAKGWTLDEQLIDPGKSAYRGKHMSEGGSLGRFFSAVKAGQVRSGDILLFEGFDRFSRQPPDVALPLFLELIKAGIEVHTTFDGQAYSKNSLRTNQGQLYSTLSAMWAAYTESRTKGERVRSAWIRRRQTRTLICPTWIRPSADGSQYELIDDRAEIIRRIFRLALEGHGVQMICRILNRSHTAGFERHVKTGAKPKRRAAKGWHHSYVRTLLTDRRVLGEATFNEWHTDDSGTPIKTKTGITRKLYPPAVSDELWQQVQDCRRRDRQGGNGAMMSNLFTGIAKCACGASMTLVRKGTHSTYTYLQCSDARRGMGCGAKKLHRYEPVEMFILTLCGELAFGDVQLDDTGSALRAKRDAAQRQADDLDLQYAKSLREDDGPLAVRHRGRLQAEYAAKLAEVADYDRQLAKLEARPIAERLDEVRRLIEQMDTLPSDEKIAARSRINRGLSEFIAKIVFNDQNPPRIATRPAEYVSANEWYVWFADAFPAHMINGPNTIVMMGMALQTGYRPTQEIGEDGKRYVRYDIRLPVKK